MDRQLHLRDNVGYINSDVLPPDTGCNFLCLSDQQTFILRAFVFPFAYWPTRTVKPLDGNTYLTDEVTLSAIQGTLEDLELQLSGGGVMGCESIAAALVALADAITAQTAAGGSGCVTNVSCGSGSLTGDGGALGNLTPAQIIGGPQEEPPEINVPPDGFATWQAYLTYKCQAATYLFNMLRSSCTISTGFAGYVFGAATATGLVAILVDALVVELAAISVVGLLAAILGFAALGAVAFICFEQVGEWLDDHRDDIICQLYTSGDGVEAMSILQTAIENAAQAVVWAGVLEGLGVAGVPLIVDFLGALVTPDTVRPLFKLFLDINLPDADCSTCYTEDLLLNGHFLSGLANWESPGGNVSVLDSTRLRWDSNSANGMNYINQEVTLTESRTYFVGLKGNQGPAPHLADIKMVIDVDTVLTLPTGDDEVHEELGAVYLAAGVHTVYVGVEQMGAYPAYDGALDYASLR